MAVFSQMTQQEGLYLIIIFLIGIMACLQVFFFYKLSRIQQHHKDVFLGCKGDDLEALLLANRASLSQILLENQELKDKVDRQEIISSRNLRRVGLIRYDAFKEVSGNMSYSLAILNDSGCGFIITGIFTQEHGRNYIKGVRNWGPAENALTEEEEKAIKLAYKDSGAITQ